MKGIIFTEVLDSIDQYFGEQVTDRVIGKCSLSSGGGYTSIGRYDPSELHTLVEVLSADVSIPQDELQRLFGLHLFGRFAELYPVFFTRYDNATDMLKAIGSEVHAEVSKLCTEARLPAVETIFCEGKRMTLRYRSERRLESFCHGLIEACFAYFRERAEVTMQMGHDEKGVFHDFEIVKKERFYDA